MSAKSRRSKLALVAAGAALAAGMAMSPATAATVGTAAGGATAEPGPTLKGLVLTGTCPGAAPDLKNVLLSPKVDYLWAPLRFSSGTTFKPLNKWIFPAQLSVTGNEEGLKSRHMLSGATYTRPWPIPSLRPVTCEFDGAVKTTDGSDGSFHVSITGTIVGSGSLFGW